MIEAVVEVHQAEFAELDGELFAKYWCQWSLETLPRFLIIDELQPD